MSRTYWLRSGTLLCALIIAFLVISEVVHAGFLSTGLQVTSYVQNRIICLYQLHGKNALRRLGLNKDVWCKCVFLVSGKLVLMHSTCVGYYVLRAVGSRVRRQNAVENYSYVFGAQILPFMST